MTIQKTKIVATLGPATSGRDNIKKIADAGVNVFRLNFSHGAYETHQENFDAIRAIAKDNNAYYSVLADLQGPKLRVGDFKNDSVILKKGQSFQLDMNEELGDETRVSLMHPEIFAALEENMTLLVNDGFIQLKVNSFTKDTMQTTVLVGGKLSNHKGVNVPDVVLPISALTPKDLKDLDYALKMGADWICLSFVQQPDDVKMARDIIKDKDKIIVKIEKPSAIQYLEEIIALTDGVMVARGDLGVECDLQSVPTMQRRIIEICRRSGKPVIVATQMLESMINSPVPTRAEVTDVSTAVLEGADAVMLSAETAVGAYPVETVSMMRKIILQAQKDEYYKQSMDRFSMPPAPTITNAITSSMKNVVKVLENPACIVACSTSGKTTLSVSRERATPPILNITGSVKVANQMALAWGVQSVVVDTLNDIFDVGPLAVNEAKKMGFVKPGDQIIISAGLPFGKVGSTNVLHVALVD